MSQAKSPSVPPQNKLLNRVSGLFQKRRPGDDLVGESSSSAAGEDQGGLVASHYYQNGESSVTDYAQQQQQQQQPLPRLQQPTQTQQQQPFVYSADSHHSNPSHRSVTPPDDNTEAILSRVDSMFSSFQSTRSVANSSTANAPPPLRTVNVDNAIVHKQDSSSLRPPTPPAKDTRQTSTSTSATAASTPPPLAPAHTSSSTLAQPPPSATVPGPASVPAAPTKTNEQEVDEAFDKLLQEFALPANLRPNLDQLTTEQKAVLLQSSKSRLMQRKNLTNPKLSFSLGLQRKDKWASVRSSKFFNTDNVTTSAQQADTPESRTRKLAQTTSARPVSRRTSILSAGMSVGKTLRNKLKSSPEYFIQLLQETPVRDLEETDVMDLRVFLRSVVASWTTEFIRLGGYEAISNLFCQMKEAQKRSPNDDKIVQQLAKCFKTIMTHEMGGTQKVLTDLSAVEHIRDLLLGPPNMKQKALYGLSITTRALLLNILCTLATLQVRADEEKGTPYIHGYDVLRRLLYDRVTDKVRDEEDKSGDLPFRMSLRTDPQAYMEVILENDPEAAAAAATGPQGQIEPRYTAWMRELQFTVEKHIEPMAFLASALGYGFESAFRQLKIKSGDAEGSSAEKKNGKPKKPDEGLVTADDGVVDYLVTHLRLICTLITTPPTTFTGQYTGREKEKVRMEIMLSGFEKVSKALRCCPHPLLYTAYHRYLNPILQKCGELDVPLRPLEESSSSEPHAAIETYEAMPEEEMMLEPVDPQDQEDLASLSLYDGDLNELDLYDDIFEENSDEFDTNYFEEEGPSDVDFSSPSPAASSSSKRT